MHDLQIWQEYECPNSGIDFDIYGVEIVATGEKLSCSGCGMNHIAGIDIQLQTYIRLADGELNFRGTPSSIKEKEEWIAELSMGVKANA